MKKVVFFVALLFCVFSANAQKRDHLTEIEADLVRESQEINLRIEVFIKTIDRRFLLLQNPNATQTDKEFDKWGELPKGTQIQLLNDIDKILEEAISNIDNVAEKDLNSKLFPKAMKVFNQACKRFIPLFENLAKGLTDQKEKDLVANSVENCNLVITAMQKVPEPEPEKKKGKN
ncbi:MAG: hypothetical protein MUC29_03280 [Pyrinomonadaceae bacterium]|jgi:hypothetical protein|nr:hypothetical protein [Pyrinomonadaceae bacterium]